MTTAHLPEILAGDRDDEAVRRVRDYYWSNVSPLPGGSAHDESPSRPVFSGARFDTFASDQNPPNELTPADLLAVGLLGVHVPGSAALQFLEIRHREISGLLSELDPTDQLGYLSKAAFERHLGDADSPGHRLWRLLRGQDIGVKLKVGPVITSKLLARKRPHLVPIYDRHIGEAMGLGSSEHHWVAMHELMSSPELVERLTRIRSAAGIESIPLLRVFDVATWHAKSQKDPADASKANEPENPHGKEVVGEAEDDAAGL